MLYTNYNIYVIIVLRMKEARMWEIEFYETKNGKSPVKDFIKGLDKNMKSKAVHEIELLEEYGNNLREPYSKYIANGIFELRIKFSSDISRIFYFFYVENKIILTNGFIKKTQKTPKSEIEKAIKYKEDYLSRFK